MEGEHGGHRVGVGGAHDAAFETDPLRPFGGFDLWLLAGELGDVLVGQDGGSGRCAGAGVAVVMRPRGVSLLTGGGAESSIAGEDKGREAGMVTPGDDVWERACRTGAGGARHAAEDVTPTRDRGRGVRVGRLCGLRGQPPALRAIGIPDVAHPRDERGVAA